MPSHGCIFRQPQDFIVEQFSFPSLFQRSQRLRLGTARREAGLARRLLEVGARPLNRFLENRIETPLSRMLLDGSLSDGDSVFIEFEAGEFVFRVTRKGEGRHAA